MSSNTNKSDEPSSRLSDIAIRKKKNADAQAAFRARRNNYITTLEETVLNLESVVKVLQDSCREARTETHELQQENSRLRQALRDRENFWRAMWPRKGEGDDFPSYPSPPGSQSSFSGASPHIPQYPDGGAGYREDSAVCSAGDQYPANLTPHHSPNVGFSAVENNTAVNSSHRITPKYTPYFNQVPTIREATWPQTLAQSSSSGNETGVAPSSSHSSNSPHFAESPTLTSPDIFLPNRYPTEDQKVPLSNLEPVPYAFSSSRSISPSSSTPPSSSSTSLTSPFQGYGFNETLGVQDRQADFDHRRTSAPPAAVTLHGGTADISLPSGSGSDNSLRYRLGNARRIDTGSDRGLLPLLPSMSGGSDNGSQHGSDGDSGSFPQHPLRPRRGDTAPSRSSRSPSPGLAPLSGTLAVIKAQAFGALRRTRVRSSRKPVDGAAKVARDVLESTYGVGQAGVKRRRTNEEADDDLDVL